MNIFAKFAVFFGHKYPFIRGRDFFFRNFVKGKTLSQAFSEMAEFSRTRHGFEMSLSKNEYLSDWIRLYGDYDKHTRTLLLHYFRPNTIFLDVGANLGYFSLVIAQSFGSAAKVIAFEPNPRIREHFSHSVERNQFDSQIKILPFALGDTPGKAHLNFSNYNAGEATLGFLENAVGMIDVEVQRGDDLFKTGEISEAISLIKIDVEGYELQALIGLSGILMRDKPVLLLECIDEHLIRAGTSLADLLAFLEAHSYREILRSGINRLFVHAKYKS